MLIVLRMAAMSAYMHALYSAHCFSRPSTRAQRFDIYRLRKVMLQNFVQVQMPTLIWAAWIDRQCTFQPIRTTGACIRVLCTGKYWFSWKQIFRSATSTRLTTSQKRKALLCCALLGCGALSSCLAPYGAVPYIIRVYRVWCRGLFSALSNFVLVCSILSLSIQRPLHALVCHLLRLILFHRKY